jgi:ComF family protein
MSIFRQFIDLIYPPRCPICGGFLRDKGANSDQPGFPICLACLDDFTEITHPCCSICSRPFESWVEEDHPCEACLRKRPFYTRLVVPYLYEGTLMTAVHQFKYGGKNHLAKSLGPLLAEFAEEQLSETDSVLVMPVPLHPKRLKERGFNQSLLLARHVTTQLNAELDFLSLKRIRYTQPQTGLKKDERRKNVRKAFGLTDPKGIKGRTVILVDDVATTGNTLNECARTVRRAGAENVYGAVLARTAGSY